METITSNKGNGDQELQRANTLWTLVKDHQYLLSRLSGFGKPLNSDEHVVASTLWGDVLPKEEDALRQVMRKLINDPAQDYDSLAKLLEEMRESVAGATTLRMELERKRSRQLISECTASA